jgi:threonine synthase
MASELPLGACAAAQPSVPSPRLCAAASDRGTPGSARQLRGAPACRARAPPRLLAVELAADPDRAAEGPDGIARAAREAVSELSGAVVRVDAALAKAAMGWAALEAGVEASAAGAAALAGLARALEQGRVERASTTLVLLTGGSVAAGESEATSASDLAAVERAARGLELA